MNKFIFKKEKIIKFSTETNKKPTGHSKAGALGQPGGMGWGGRRGGGLGQGDTSTPMADSCQRMAKTNTIL